MKIAAPTLAVLLLLATFASATNDNVVTEAVLFVDGFLRGALAQNVSSVNDCLKDGDKIVVDFNKLMEDARESKVYQLIGDMKALVEDIPASVKDCHNLPSAVNTTLKDWEQKLSSSSIMKLVTKALWYHRTELENDINGFEDGLKARNFEEAGEKLGDIPHIIFDEPSLKTTSPSATAIRSFLNGFLNAIMQKDMTDVGECLDNTDKLFDTIEQAIADFKEGHDIAKVLAFFGQISSLISETLTNCTTFKEKFTTVLAGYRDMLMDLSLMMKIGTSCLPKFTERLLNDVYNFRTMWESGNFEESGKNLGDILHVVFEVCPGSL